MTLSTEMKIQLFERVLELEHLSAITTYDNRDYFSESEGAFSMLQILGLGKEYVEWSIGR